MINGSQCKQQEKSAERQDEQLNILFGPLRMSLVMKYFSTNLILKAQPLKPRSLFVIYLKA